MGDVTEELREMARAGLRDILSDLRSASPTDLRLAFQILEERAPGLTLMAAWKYIVNAIADAAIQCSWAEQLIWEETGGILPERRPFTAALHLLRLAPEPEAGETVWGTAYNLYQIRNLGGHIIMSQDPRSNRGLRQRMAAVAGGYGVDRTVMHKDRPAMKAISAELWRVLEIRLRDAEWSEFDPSDFDDHRRQLRWHDRLLGRFASILGKGAVALGAPPPAVGDGDDVTSATSRERARRRFHKDSEAERPLAARRRKEAVTDAINDWVETHHQLEGMYNPDNVRAAIEKSRLAKAQAERKARRQR